MNHFLEFNTNEAGEEFLFTHFGSRGIGAALARHFDAAIAREMNLWGISTADRDTVLYVPYETELGQLYYLYNLMMLEWSAYNHRFVHELVWDVLTDLGYAPQPEFIGHIPHNFVENRNGKFVGRKGATPAYEFDNIPMLIPGSMSTGSYVMRPGLEAHRLGETVAHGAGRVLGRRAAKNTLDQNEADQQFNNAGVMGNFRNVPIDESSGAYKDIDTVVESLVDSGVATVEMRLKPFIVLKGD